MRRRKALDEEKIADLTTDMSSMKEICFNQASTGQGNFIQLLNAIDVFRTPYDIVYNVLS